MLALCPAEVCGTQGTWPVLPDANLQPCLWRTMLVLQWALVRRSRTVSAEWVPGLRSSVMNNPIHSCCSWARHFLFSFALSSNIKGQHEFMLLFYHRSVIWLLKNNKKYKGIRFFLIPGLLQGGINCSQNLSGESVAIVLVSTLLHTSINLLVTVLAKLSHSVSF